MVHQLLICSSPIWVSPYLVHQLLICISPIWVSPYLVHQLLICIVPLSGCLPTWCTNCSLLRVCDSKGALVVYPQRAYCPFGSLLWALNGPGPGPWEPTIWRYLGLDMGAGKKGYRATAGAGIKHTAVGQFEHMHCTYTRNICRVI